jgi:hypothetical protein
MLVSMIERQATMLVGMIEREPVRDTGPAVATDGPDGVYVPASAADFALLDIAEPTHLWLCQDAATPLAAAAGGITLPHDGTTGDLSYQNTVTGWTRKFLGMTGGSSNRWTTQNAALDIPLNGSVACLVYAAADGAVASRGVAALASDEFMIVVNAADQAVCRCTGGNGTGSVASFDNITTVRPFLYVRDCVANTTRVYTHAEQVNATHTDNAATPG